MKREQKPQQKPAVCRPVAMVFEFDTYDELGRLISYRAQYGPGERVACWLADDPQSGGRITIQELFSYCCLKAGGTK